MPRTRSPATPVQTYSGSRQSPIPASGTLIRFSDFNSGQGDKIDLSAIDADAGTAGDQAFTFIGSGVFTGVAGQLHFDLNFVEGDVNGDAVADFRIGVAQPTLAATDFFVSDAYAWSGAGLQIPRLG